MVRRHAVSRGTVAFIVAAIVCTGLLRLPELAFGQDPWAGHDFSGSGTVSADPDGDPCGELLYNGDELFENAIGWRYGGTVPPYWGAFAEKYSGAREICALSLYFTSIGTDFGQTFDAYVWEDTDGLPGTVLCVQFGIDPGPIAYWPSVSNHEAPLAPGCCVDGDWWCGWWGDWPGQTNGWFQAENHAGPAGYPYTNIAPGLGYPTGWNNVSIVWGPHQSLGIGANVVPCPPVPIERSTWGAIKSLYRRG